MPRLNRLAAWLAVVLFAGATLAMLLQPLYADPFCHKDGLARFVYPAETNAFWRLRSISANLNDLRVEVGENGRPQLWAVGDGGAILYSPDGGRCWETQGPRGAGGDRNDLRAAKFLDIAYWIPNLISSGLAAEQTYKRAEAAYPSSDSNPAATTRGALVAAGAQRRRSPRRPGNRGSGILRQVARGGGRGLPT